MRLEFGLLQAHGGIKVGQSIALRLDHLPRVPQQDFAVDAFVGGVRVGKVCADVSKGECTQHGVTNDVEQHVGVAVAHRSFVMRNGQAANDEVLALGQLVNVVAVTDAQAHSSPLT